MTNVNEDVNVSATNGIKYGSVVVYKCKEGYQIDGVPRTYCQQGGAWKHGDTKPTCKGKSTVVSCLVTRMNC